MCRTETPMSSDSRKPWISVGHSEPSFAAEFAICNPAFPVVSRHSTSMLKVLFRGTDGDWPDVEIFSRSEVENVRVFATRRRGFDRFQPDFRGGEEVGFRKLFCGSIRAAALRRRCVLHTVPKACVLAAGQAASARFGCRITHASSRQVRASCGLCESGASRA